MENSAPLVPYGMSLYRVLPDAGPARRSVRLQWARSGSASLYSDIGSATTNTKRNISQPASRADCGRAAGSSTLPAELDKQVLTA